MRQYGYDVAAARDLLRAAGWSPGSDGVLVNGQGERFEITCTVFSGDQLRRSIAETVQRTFRDVGIDLRLRELETATAIRAAGNGEYDVAVWLNAYGGGSGEPDARHALSTGAFQNFSHWSNAEADRLLEQGAAATDPQQRRGIYAELQRLVADEVPFLFLVFPQTVVHVNRRLRGLPDEAPNPMALFQSFHRCWIEEE